MLNKQYLGDSVYAEHDGFSIILTTENDDGPPSHTIYLEPEVYKALVMYHDKMWRGPKDGD